MAKKVAKKGGKKVATKKVAKRGRPVGSKNKKIVKPTEDDFGQD